MNGCLTYSGYNLPFPPFMGFKPHYNKQFIYSILLYCLTMNQVLVYGELDPRSKAISKELSPTLEERIRQLKERDSEGLNG